MRVEKLFRYSMWLLLLVPLLVGCPQPPVGGGDGNGTTNGDGNGETTGNGGGGLTGGFQDNGLTEPVALAPGVENPAPTGELLFPPQGATAGHGEVVFVWQAVASTAPNVDTTPLVRDQPGGSRAR